MPFLAEYFDLIAAVDYPKSKLHLFVHNAVEYHADVVNAFIDNIASQYASIKTILPSDNVAEHDARELAV